MNNLFKIIPEFYQNCFQTEIKIGTLIFSLNTWFYFSSFRPKLKNNILNFSFTTIYIYFSNQQNIFGFDLAP